MYVWDTVYVVVYVVVYVLGNTIKKKCVCLATYSTALTEFISAHTTEVAD